MQMTRKMKAASGLTVLTAILALVSVMSMPSEAEGSACYPYTLNRPVWASGSTCAQAEANLQSAGVAEAQRICGMLMSTVCGSVTVQATNSCYFQGGMYKIDGQATFQCHP
ncbi:MAG: hypothetical protein AAF657_30270 [Acidobacteriota bacterium]